MMLREISAGSIKIPSDRFLLGDFKIHDIKLQARKTTDDTNDLKARISEYFTEDIIESMIRVDYSGECGAVWIYSAQAYVLNLYRTLLSKLPLPLLQKSKLLALLENSIAALNAEIQDENVHLNTFASLMQQNAFRPTLVHPLWLMTGNLLGAITAALGLQYIAICTYAIESVIAEHYTAQLQLLDILKRNLESAIDDAEKITPNHRCPELAIEIEYKLTLITQIQNYIAHFLSHEIQHRDQAKEKINSNPLGVCGQLAKSVIKLGSRIAISISKAI